MEIELWKKNVDKLRASSKAIKLSTNKHHPRTQSEDFIAQSFQRAPTASFGSKALLSNQKSGTKESSD